MLPVSALLSSAIIVERFLAAGSNPTASNPELSESVP
jgi:hypothetical protein